MHMYKKKTERWKSLVWVSMKIHSALRAEICSDLTKGCFYAAFLKAMSGFILSFVHFSTLFPHQYSSRWQITCLSSKQFSLLHIKIRKSVRWRGTDAEWFVSYVGYKGTWQGNNQWPKVALRSCLLFYKIMVSLYKHHD